MMWCFVYLQRSSLLPKAVFPFYFHWRLISGPVSYGCSCDLACFLIWNWNYDSKIRGNLLHKWYFRQGRVGMMSMADIQMTFFLNTWSIWRQLSNEVWIDVGHPPCMSRSILDTVIFSMDRHLHCTWRTSNIVISRLYSVWKWRHFVVGEALPCEQALLYLHSLLVCHVFCLRVISFALMCNANASLIGNWHSKCYLIITQSNTITQC